MTFPRVLPALLLVLLSAAAARGDDEREKAFQFHLARARSLGRKAAATGDIAQAREAIDAYEAAGRLHPKDPVPLAEAGLLALDAGDGAAAARMLAAAHEAAPDSGAYRFLRGAILQSRGEYADAMGEFAEARKGDFLPAQAEDRHFECDLGRGFRLLDDLQFEKALEVLQEAARRKPGHPMMPLAYHRMALAWRRLREPKEAEKVLRQCIEKFPSFAVAYAELGDLCTTQQRYDEALDLLGKAVGVDPSFAAGWLLRAVALTARGDFPGADRAFEEYGKRFPANGESEMQRGVYFQLTGQPEKALERLRKSLALDPSRVRCHYVMSLCFRDLGREKEAAAALDRWRKAEEATRHGHGKDERK